MKTITLYREDFNNPLHPDLFDNLLEDLGIATHVVVAGRLVDREIDEVEITTSSVIVHSLNRERS